MKCCEYDSHSRNGSDEEKKFNNIDPDQPLSPEKNQLEQLKARRFQTSSKLFGFNLGVSF